MHCLHRKRLETKRLTDSEGVHVVYDGVGKATFDRDLNVLRPRGYLVLFGGSSGAVPPFDLIKLSQKGSLYITRPTLNHYTATREELEWRANASATYLVVINNPNTGLATTFTRVSSSTGTLTVSTTASCSNVVVVQVTNSNLALSASPSSIDLENPPATVTITGQSFDTTYGMPRVEYFDGSGYLVGSTYASSVSGGTSLDCYVPDLSSAYSGTYQIRVTNKTYQGYYSQRIGTATV